MSRQTKRIIFTLEPPAGGGEMRTGEPGMTSQFLGRAGQAVGQAARGAGSRLGELGTNAIDALGRRLRLEGMQFQNPLHIPPAYQPPVRQEGPLHYEVLSDGTLWVNDSDLAKQLVSELNLAGIETPGGAFHLGMSLDGQSGITIKGLESQGPHQIEPLDPQVIRAIVPVRTSRVERG